MIIANNSKIVKMDNQEIAQLLRNMAASYEVLGESRFKVIAYRQAADSIEHLTSELKDIWDEGKLEEVAGIGKNIASHLEELFRRGRVAHFEKVMRRVPKEMFVLMRLSGVGAKTAYRLAKEINKFYKTSRADQIFKGLERLLKKHKICQLEGFGEKKEQEILEAIAEYRRGQKKEKRIPLFLAEEIASEIIGYLRKIPEVLRANPLGSLRRRVSTIGDIDIAVSSNYPKKIIEHFLSYAKKEKIVEKGDKGATILIEGGVQIDLRVSKPKEYGAMLQYFTGSKQHNIKLRELALKRGLSLSEYGVKKVQRLKTGSKFKAQSSNVKRSPANLKLYKFENEKEFYNFLGMEWIPPELRENQGEIEAAMAGKLPKLVELSDIKGDLHLHSNYQMPVSHDLGRSSLEELLRLANNLGYEYIGLADHNPKQADLSASQIVQILKRRKQYFEQKLYGKKSVQKFSRTQKVYIFLEIDIKPNGNLALPDEAFEYLDGAIASLHSSFKMRKDLMTKRILRGISHPKVKILGHPTARMIGERESVEADWEKIFHFCKKRGVALEINSWPGRLDLPDFLVREAVRQGVKLIINTDSHESQEMRLMRYGVSVARRGWASKSDIINTLGKEEFEKWLLK